jgi:hypothetical protein
MFDAKLLIMSATCALHADVLELQSNCIEFSSNQVIDLYILTNKIEECAKVAEARRVLLQLHALAAALRAALQLMDRVLRSPLRHP